MKSRDNKQGIIWVVLALSILSVLALLSTAVSALTDDGNPNYIRGAIKINGLPALQGTQFNVTVTSGANIGFQYNGSVDDSKIPPFLYGNGYYDSGDQTGFSTGDSFRVESCGSLNTGIFVSGGNGGFGTGSVDINCTTSDTQAPVVSLMVPQNNTTDYDGIVDFIYNVTDTSGIDSCSLFINNSASAFSSSVQKNVPQTFSKNLTNGDYSWYVRCMDNSTNFNAGNSETRFLTVQISSDLAPPSINLVSPANSAVLTNQNVLFSYIANDTLSGIQSCSLIVDNAVDQTSTNITEEITQTFVKTLANGIHSWAINCTDSSPNTNHNTSQARTLTINSTSLTAEINLTPIADSFVDKLNPITNYGNWPDLYLNPGTSSTNRIYFRWDLSQIPANTSIISAEIYMYGQSYSDSIGRTAEAHFVSDDSWNETGAGGITWSNAPSFNPAAESTSLLGTQNSWYNFTVVSSVVSERNAGDTLYSAAIKYATETDGDVWKRFRSREYAGASLRPYLRLVYSVSPPSITQVNIPPNANEGSSLNISFIAVDPENDILSYAILKNGTIVSNISSFIWQTDYQSAGYYLFEFRVNDTTGLAATEQRIIQITNVPNVVINEFVSQPLLLNETEWIELYNPTPINKSLDGCYISNSGPITLNLTGYLNPLEFGFVDIPVSYMVNTGDIIRLKCGNILYDKVSYGNYDDGNIPDNAPVAFLGNSTGRISDGYDTDVDINDFKIYSNPTKGYSNADSTAPSINNITVSGITNSTATVSWNTNENANSTINYGLSSLNLNLRFSNNSLAMLHNLSITGLQSNSTYYYNVSSCDIVGNCESSSILNFTTIANAPNIAPIINPVSNITVNEGQVANITIVASDANNDTLAFSINDSRFAQSGSSQNGNVYTSWFTWLTDFNSVGTYEVAVTASDGQLATSQNVTVTVNNINRAPALDLIGNKIVLQNQTLQFAVNASDPDNDNLVYSTLGLPQGANFDNATRTFTWTPAFSQSGNFSVTFSASDGNLSDLENIIINVIGVNVAPSIDSFFPQNSTITINEGQNQTFSVTTSDLNGDNLTVSWELNGVTVATGNNFTFFSNFSSSAVNNVTAIVSDGQLNTSKLWNLLVNNVNRAPVLQVIGDKNIAENQTLQFVVDATDADNDTIMYSASGLPQGANFDNATKTFTWTPNFNQSANYSITFIASDGLLNATETIAVNVANTNRMPAIDLYGPLTDPIINENQTVFFYISASDPDNDALATYWYLDGNLSFVGNATSTYAYTPDFNSAGVHTMKGIASDGMFNISKNWTIAVLNINRAPVID
ncbi:MAG TPA: DNRLRE domain-containing protein, partial [Candidatus Nanoarchaeia archaeon]|nr:DNRLRE domain-containing protein [Candidatus Nanoarchaeia archaeon]